MTTQPAEVAEYVRAFEAAEDTALFGEQAAALIGQVRAAAAA